MPFSHLRIRPSRRDDLATLAAIWSELMQMHQAHDTAFALADDALSRWQQMVRDMVDRDDTFVLLAEGPSDSGVHGAQPQVLGFCLGWVAHNPPIYRVPEVGFISEIAVAQAARRRGVGRALMEAARAWFAGRRLSEFQLSTAVWNDVAQAFWVAVGGAPLLLRYRFLVAPARP